MKILLFNAHYLPYPEAGSERAVRFLAESLVQHGHEAVVVCRSYQVDEPRTRWINGVKVYYYQFQGHQDTEDQIASLLTQEAPDLVHTNFMQGLSSRIWTVTHRHGIPLLHTLHDYALPCKRFTLFRDGQSCGQICPECQPYATRIQELANTCLSGVVGVGQFILQRHRELGYFQSVPFQTVIPSAYAPPAIAPTGFRRSPFSLQLGYLGRIVPEKGIQVLLEILTQHLSDQPWSLRIGGDMSGEFATSLQNRYGSDRIQFLGIVTPERFFPRIDALVVPSLWDDPLPRVVFEAFAYGVPVLGAQRGGIPEMVESGQTGFCFDPLQPETFRTALTPFLKQPDLAQQLGQLARHRSQTFSPNRVFHQYLKVYQTLLSIVP